MRSATSSPTTDARTNPTRSEGRVRERIGYHYLPPASYELKLKDGNSVSADDWEPLWKSVAKSEVRSISMRGSGSATELTITLPLEGSAGTADVKSDDAAEYNEHLGYFMQLCASRHAPTRRFLSLDSWTGVVIWLVLPIVAVIAWLVRGLPGYDIGVVVSASFNVGALVGAVLLIVANIVTPRVAPNVAIRGVGPHQGFRAATQAGFIGMIVAALSALASVVLPALAGGGAPAPPMTAPPS